MKTQQENATALSPRVLALFLLYLQWYVPKHFHALRVAHAERFPSSAHPLICCINHASWWDPLVILLLSKQLAPGRFAHAPMEAEALQHYGFFRRIGAFPVDNTSPRAGAQFLRQAAAILSRPEAILWMTPEGRFTDARQRPILWKPGTAALTRHLDSCTVVPLAVEYTFWDERLPEVLCSIGEPMVFSSADRESTAERTQRLEAAMMVMQDELVTRALKRDGTLFTTVFSGSAGVGIFYDLWRRMKSTMTGKPYVAEHGTIAQK
jgi:1-acyl-sn-glycerol-3-phosphate acyltransferase